jgi:MoaA/NifB/PqqE/SkfB family radical SAM enzyme
VTYVCNNDCVFCAVGPRTGITEHPPPQRRELEALCRRGVRAVDFDGGEPTTNPELIPLLRHARALGFEHIGVTTNGRMAFYEDYARKLVTSGVTSLVFSIHGPDAELHARHVGVAEAFEQAIAGIRQCVKRAPPGVRLGMSTTVTRHNAARLVEMGELACALGLRNLELRAVTPFGRDTASVAAGLETTAAAMRSVIDAYGDRLAIRVRDLPFCQLRGYEHLVDGDPGMLAHHRMVTHGERVHLAQYLADQRVRRPVCLECAHAVYCGGFFDTQGAPDPAWMA